MTTATAWRWPSIRLPALPDDATFWTATLAAMAASWFHLAQWIARYEWAHWWPVAALAATAIDLGILAGMRKVRQWAKDRPNAAAHMRDTVLGLTYASSIANAQHAWAIGSEGVTGWALFGVLVNSILVSAILPWIVYRFCHALEVAESEAPKDEKPPEQNETPPMKDAHEMKVSGWSPLMDVPQPGDLVTVYDEVNGVTSAHRVVPRRNGHTPAQTRTRRKPSPEDRAEWRRLSGEGMTAGQIAKAGGDVWAESTIRGVLNRDD